MVHDNIPLFIHSENPIIICLYSYTAAVLTDPRKETVLVVQ